jgi:hypothetical protein
VVDEEDGMGGVLSRGRSSEGVTLGVDCLREDVDRWCDIDDEGTGRVSLGLEGRPG